VDAKANNRAGARTTRADRPGLRRGRPNSEVATDERVSRPTVGRWGHRFVERRCDGLLDEPKPGAPRCITDADVERVLTITLESTPRDATHWSTRSLAKECSLSQTAVARIWKAFALQPHCSKTSKLSKDPLLIDKVRDVVGLYLNPPDRALVLCVDEKSQIQALDRTAPLLPMRPGQVERRTHDYVRRRTTSLCAALDAKTGAVLDRYFRRDCSRELRRFLDLIEAQVPRDLNVHLLLDNYGTHKTPMTRRWLIRPARWETVAATVQAGTGKRRRTRATRPLGKHPSLITPTKASS